MDLLYIFFYMGKCQNNKGSWQVKKNPKIRKKTQIGPDLTHPPPYTIFYFFGNMYNNKKKHNFQKKRKSELGLESAQDVDSILF